MSLFDPCELQELLIEAVDPYFELSNAGLRAVKRFFELGGELAQLQFHLSEIIYGRLQAKNGSCVTSDLKVMIRAVNKLKRRSTTGKDASVGSKINKTCL